MRHLLHPLRRLAAAIHCAALLGIACSNTAEAQLFQKTYPVGTPIHAQGTRWTTDGGQITVGIVNYSYVTTIVLQKTNSVGVVQWSKQLVPGPNVTERVDFGFAVRQLTDDRGNPQGYYVVGATEEQTPGTKSILVIRTDNGGNVLWRKRYTGTQGNAVGYNFEIQKTPGDEHLIVTGYIDATEVEGIKKGQRAFLMKLDLNGTLLWCRKFGIAWAFPNQHEQNVGFAVQHVGNGYVLTGYTNPSGLYTDKVPFIVRTGLAGNILWGYTYPTPANAAGYADGVGKSIRLMPDGGFVVVGMANAWWPRGNDMLVLRTNAVGQTTWMNLYDAANASEGSNNDLGWEIYPVPSNNTLDVVGTTTFVGSDPVVGDHVMITSIAFNGPYIRAEKYTHAPVVRTVGGLFVGIDREVGVGADQQDIYGLQIVTAEAPLSGPLSGISLIKVYGIPGEPVGCHSNVDLQEHELNPHSEGVYQHDDDCSEHMLTKDSYELYPTETECPPVFPKSEPSISEGEGEPVAGQVATLPNVLRSGEPLEVRYTAQAGATVTIRVSNALGEVVYSTTGEAGDGERSAVIDASAWASGSYFVETVIDGKSSTTTVNVVR